METKYCLQHMIASAAFVSAIAIVGYGSHTGVAINGKLSDLVDGSLQSTYEIQFEASNPLERIAVSGFGAARYAIFGEASPGAIVGTDGWLFTAEELEVSEGFDTNIDASVAEIQRVKSVLESRSVKLLPVIVPDKAEVYGEHLGAVRPDLIADRKSVLTHRLGQQGVMWLDATQPLMDAKETTPSFVKDDTHWSPEGSRAVANTVAARVAGMDLTPATVSTTYLGQHDFDGDLLAYVPTGWLRPWVGPAQLQISQYETTVETSGGLFGDPTIDVALVGTSFSAKADWHFAGFLQHALGADLLNFAEEGQGPFSPMRAFLNSEAFETTPPKLVIWEIPVRYTSKEMNK